MLTQKKSKHLLKTYCMPGVFPRASLCSLNPHNNTRKVKSKEVKHFFTRLCSYLVKDPGFQLKQSVSICFPLNHYEIHMHTCMLNNFSCVQFFAIPWTITCQDPLSWRFFRQEYWSEFPCPSPGDLPDPGIEPVSPAAPALQAEFFTTEPLGNIMLQKDEHIQGHILETL